MSEILSDSKRKQHWVHFTHCPKNNLNIRRVTEPFMVTADATVYTVYLCQILFSICSPKPDIYRLNLLHPGQAFCVADIQNSFGTVYSICTMYMTHEEQQGSL